MKISKQICTIVQNVGRVTVVKTPDRHSHAFSGQLHGRQHHLSGVKCVHAFADKLDDAVAKEADSAVEESDADKDVVVGVFNVTGTEHAADQTDSRVNVITSCLSSEHVVDTSRELFFCEPPI